MRPAAFPCLLAGVVTAAWLSLWLWGASPYAHYRGHRGELASPDGWMALLLFITGWTLMVTAMMLPTAATLLRSFAVLVRNRPERGRLQALVCVGFVGALGVGLDLGIGDAVS